MVPSATAYDWRYFGDNNTPSDLAPCKASLGLPLGKNAGAQQRQSAATGGGCRLMISISSTGACKDNHYLIECIMSLNSSIDPILTQSHEIDPELLDSHTEQEDLARCTPEEEAVSRINFHKPPSPSSTSNGRSLKLSFSRQGTSFPISGSESRRQRPLSHISIFSSHRGIRQSVVFVS